jgi:hypothetical protein
LKVFREKGYADYFLVVSQSWVAMIRWILTSIFRGTAGQAVDWVFGRYGARSVAMVANQNMLGVRGAIREVANTALQLLDAISRRQMAPMEYIR